MKFLNLNINRHKGISSIVGGIFFLVLMTAGFTVYYVALDSQAQMLDTQQIIADSEISKIQEDFVVAASSDPVDNRLSLQVANTGNNPIEVADVWIINKTYANEPAERYDIDYNDVSIPVGYTGNILKNTALYLDPEIYDIKVISSLGTIRTIEFDVNGGSNILKAQMVAIPQDVRFGENVTVALIVTNVGTEKITEVSANNLDVDPNQCENTPNGIFLGPTDLLPSQSSMFFWDCVLEEPIGNTITFTGNATGQLEGTDIHSNNAIDSVIVRDFSAGNFGDELILKDELFGRPELFLIIPNVFGSANGDNGKGYWGVNIANPTNKTMTVSKVSISALRGNSNDNIDLFDPNNCNIIEISPIDGKWECPNPNVVTWKNVDSPITIPKQSAYPFILKVNPGKSADSLETVVVSASTFTSLGAFGTGPYETSTKKAVEGEAIANVYTTDATNDIQGVILGVPSGAYQTFNVTMADFSEDPVAIDNTSELVINIPKEWTYDDTSVTTSGFNTPIHTTFADGSTQVVASLSADLDNAEAWVQFSATAPPASGGNAKMYVFHILGSGKTTSTDPYLIGPIAETVVQVCPTSGCP